MTKEYALFLDVDETITRKNSWRIAGNMLGVPRSAHYLEFSKIPSGEHDEFIRDWIRRDAFEIHSRLKEGDVQKIFDQLEIRKDFFEFLSKYRGKFGYIGFVSGGFPPALKLLSESTGIEAHGHVYELVNNPPKSKADIVIKQSMYSKKKQEIMLTYGKGMNIIYVADDFLKGYEGNHNNIFRIYMDGDEGQIPRAKDFSEVAQIIDIVLSNDFEDVLQNIDQYFVPQEV
ncbi:MAG: hypothetical protein GOV01_03345 [Candidatus Altiarchaeota archaeon]|nr:hypothetical protein [Candidatus Altiarchaeota archaeon]